MLDRISLSVLGTSVVVSCAAGYPEPRPSSADSERAGREAGPLQEDPTREAEPETWAESLDSYVFGSSRRESASRRDGSSRGDRPSAADRARRLEIEGSRALEEGRAEEAFLSFRRAYDIAAADSRWKYLLVMANMRMGMRRNPEALDLYLRLLEIRPREPAIDPLLFGNLALLYYRLGRLPEAREAVGRALSLEPEFPEALRTLGLIEVEEGRVEEGVALLRRAVERKPSIPEAQVALAEHEEAIGRRDEAAERYRDLLSVMESEGFQDPLGRWRNLFGAGKRPTEDELRDGIERLESRDGNTDNAPR